MSLNTSDERTYQQLPSTLSGYDVAANAFIPQPVTISSAYSGMQVVTVTGAVDRISIPPSPGQIVVIDALATSKPVLVQASAAGAAPVGTAASVPAGEYGLLISSGAGWFFVSEGGAGTAPANPTIDASHLLAWTFQETSGTTIANAGSAASGNLTLTGSYDLAQQGRLGSAVGFKTSTVGRGWGATSIGILTPTNSISVEAWVRPATNAGGPLYVVMQKRSSGAYDFYQGPAVAIGFSNGHPFARIGLSAYAAATLVHPTAVGANTWAYIAMTFDGATLTVYCNGVGYSQAVSGVLQTSGTSQWVVNDNGDSATDWSGGAFGGDYLVDFAAVSDIVRNAAYFRAAFAAGAAS